MTRFLALFSMCFAAAATAEPRLEYPVSELYVMSMDSAELVDGQRLVLDGVNRKVIWFTDRPIRESGVADTRMFIANWPVGTDSFAGDPPNAVIVGALQDGTEVELPLELKEPKWSDKALILSVLPLSELLPQGLRLYNAHLFIDNSSDNGDQATAWCGHVCFRPIVTEKTWGAVAAGVAESPRASRN